MPQSSPSARKLTRFIGSLMVVGILTFAILLPENKLLIKWTNNQQLRHSSSSSIQSLINGSGTELCNQETAASIVAQPLSNDESVCSLQCLEAFINGKDPSVPSTDEETKNTEVVLDGINTMWTRCRCDALFCVTPSLKERRRGIGAGRACRWTPFAVDSLLHHDQIQCSEDHRKIWYQEDYRWRDYRFSDYFKGFFFDTRRGNWTGKWTDFKVSRQYAGTLLEEYHKAAIVKEGASERDYRRDFALLKQIVERRIRQRKNETRISSSRQKDAIKAISSPLPRTLLVHLRLGDVIDGAVESVKELLLEQRFYYREKLFWVEKKNKTIPGCCEEPNEKPDNKPLAVSWNAYVRPLSFYAGINLIAYDSIVLMGSAHMGDQQKRDIAKQGLKSCRYVAALYSYFSRKFKGRVSVRLNQPPDDDIVFASQVSGFVQSGGGFSDLIAQLVNFSGGEVIAFDPIGNSLVGSN